MLPHDSFTKSSKMDSKKNKKVPRRQPTSRSKPNSYRLNGTKPVLLFPHEVSKLRDGEHALSTTEPINPNLKMHSFSPAKPQNLTRRYQSGSAVNGVYQIYDIHQTLLMAATTVLGYCPYEVARLKRMQIWAPCPSVGSPATITIQPVGVDATNNSFTDLQEIFTDTTDSVDQPAYVDFRPKITHPSGAWHYTNTVNSNLVQVAAPSGSIMEVEVEYMLNVLDNPNGFTSVLVAATAGKMYCRDVITSFVALSINRI